MCGACTRRDGSHAHERVGNAGLAEVHAWTGNELWAVGRARSITRRAPNLGAQSERLVEPTTNSCECSHVPPPNGSRLSCGRDARGRKAVEPQVKRRAGEATQLFPTFARPAASSAC